MALTLHTNCGFVTSAPSTDPAATGNNVDGTTWVMRDTTPASVNKITQIGWYCSSNPNEAPNFEVGLYDNNGGSGEAGTRLYVAATNALSDGTGWKTVSVDWDITAEKTYWIAIQIDNTTGGTQCDLTTSGGSGYDRIGSATTLNNPAGGGAIEDADGVMAIYALVENVATGTNTKINIGDAWKEISAAQINIGDAWKPVAGMKINIGDAWKTIF